MEVSTSQSSSGGAQTGGNEQTLPAPAPAPMPVANSPAPFLAKTYDMVDDPSTDNIVSWSATNNSFVVWDSAEFGRELLPKYFKHSNFSSFVRQLNTYGFRKVDPDRWEFANEGFLRGQKHLLKNITRRKPTHPHPPHPNGQNSSISACVEVGKFGLEEEVERLKRDKNVLMQELVRLRQQQQSTDGQLQAMVQRLQGMEQRQQQMMSFLAKVVNSPGFLQQFMQQNNDSNKRVAEGNKKRRLKEENSFGPLDGQMVKYQPLINEATNAMMRQVTEFDSFSPSLENFNNDGSENELTSENTEPKDVGLILPELSQIVGETDDLPLDAVGFPTDPQMEWENSFFDEMQELPVLGDPFWENFLQSPERDENVMDSSTSSSEETKNSVEEGWNKSKGVVQLTEQMGMLSSDVNKI